MPSNRVLVLIGLAAIVTAQAALSAQPPPPRKTPFTETIHGVEAPDPYRWMETGDAELQAWAKSESAWARTELDAIPGRAALYKEIEALEAPIAGISRLQVRKDRWLYQRVLAGGKPALVVRTGKDGDEKPVDLLAGLPVADGPWSEVVPARALSPDGRYVLFGTTQKGEANPALRVYDLDQDRMLPDVVEWPLWADASGFRARWLTDSSGFLYVRNPDASAGMDNTARARRGQVLLHRLGAAAGSDRALFGFGLTPGITDTDTLYVEGAPHPRWLTIWRRKPEGRELWVLDLTQLSRPGQPDARRLWTSDVSTPGYGVRGDSLYVADSVDSPRFRLLRFDLTQPSPVAEVALPQQEGVLTHVLAAHDAVYVVESVLNSARVHVVDPSGTRRVALGDGAVVALDPGPENEGTWITQVDWLTPRRGGWLAPGDTRLRDVGLAPSAGPASAPTNTSSRLGWAVARDGERIPFTIVKGANTRADASAYVLMNGYGCFGSADPPFYWPSLHAWLQRGGVFVQVAMRGGGELGADWHRAGRDRNKPASFEDAIDVAKHLVREGITRPGRIGVSGGSCGGLTMGMAALEAPHLIGAAVLSVGAFDPLRMAANSAAGARSIRDIGDPATAEGTRRILALSPYRQLLDGAPRPALLIISGATDYSIPLWVGGKMVARSREAAPAGKPVLWSIDWNAGHNVGVDYTKEDADMMAFMFRQLGHPDFQAHRADAAATTTTPAPPPR